MVTSNIYSLKYQLKRKSFKKTYYRPYISIIVPAYNEESVILRTVESLQRSNYPTKRLEIIVANDGSKDNTAAVVRSYARQKHKFKVLLVSRPNRGKAEILNYAIKHRAKNSLIMCLDADSTVDENCIRNIVQYFKDKQVVAAASNVNIVENGSLLGLAQRIEYLFSYELKKAHTVFNMEYIIGGVGSVFRRSILQDVSYYDSNTMTEDIDLTLKIVGQGNKQHKIMFASDALTYTEPVQTYKALITQRFRWKYGRLQTFVKNKHLFFNTDKKYTKQLTFFLLPMTVFYEFVNLIEPLMIGFVLYLIFVYADVSTLFSAAFIFCFLIMFGIWSSDQLTSKERLRLSAYAPASYVLIYSLVIVEYCAAFMSALRVGKIKKSLSAKKTTWQSPARNAAAGLNA